MKTLSLSALTLSATLFACTSILGGCSGAAGEEFSDDPSSSSDAIKTAKDAGTVVPPIDPPVCPPPPVKCTPEACGALPAIGIKCDDGSIPSPTVCEPQANGQCGWTYGTCPVNAGCKPDACGPLPEIAKVCDDGSIPSPPVCQIQADYGKCGWTYGTCPVSGDPLKGEWGGQQILLTATPVKDTPVSNVHIELFCASVDFSIGPIGKDGSFTSTAGYFASGSKNAEKVIVRGAVSGDQMKLEIVDLNGKSLGAFSLQKGKKFPFYKCD